MTPDTDTRKPGRPPKSSATRAAEQADALLHALTLLTDHERHRISVCLNMRHDVLLKDLEASIKAFADLARRVD
jgi:hypothetical protein